jgi:hypothetical protein
MLSASCGVTHVLHRFAFPLRNRAPVHLDDAIADAGQFRVPRACREVANEVHRLCSRQIGEDTHRREFGCDILATDNWHSRTVRDCQSTLNQRNVEVPIPSGCAESRQLVKEVLLGARSDKVSAQGSHGRDRVEAQIGVLHQ